MLPATSDKNVLRLNMARLPVGHSCDGPCGGTGEVCSGRSAEVVRAPRSAPGLTQHSTVAGGDFAEKDSVNGRSSAMKTTTGSSHSVRPPVGPTGVRPDYFLPVYSSSLTGPIHVAVPTFTAIWTSP